MHERSNSLTAEGSSRPPVGISEVLAAQLPPDADYLRRLGDRVREARARRGMTRRILSRDSRVSERYLAQLETGQGNISILLLRQIAQALDLPMQVLLQDVAEPSADLARATKFLAKLSADQLQRAYEILEREFNVADPAARHQRIALVGLRGAGKSTLGAMLAAQRHVPFIELDRVIEQRSGMGLSVIFDLYGQSGFRRLERECLEQVLQQYPGMVLATGGSLVSEAATYDLLLGGCFTAWLRATPEDHMQRVIAQGDTRPMSENREAMSELKNILAVREPLYRRADVTIDTSSQSLPGTFTNLIRATSREPQPV